MITEYQRGKQVGKTVLLSSNSAEKITAEVVLKNQREEAFTKKVAVQAKNGSLVGVTPLRLRRFEEHNASL